MQKFRPIFTHQEAKRLYAWFVKLSPEEQDEYRRMKHRDDIIAGFREVGRVTSRLGFIAFLIALAIDLLWRTWVKVSVTFPAWHVPVVSLHQFAVIALMFIASAFVVSALRGEMRRPL